MKKYWKQFAVWGTALKRNVFRWTRVKLTLLYLGIIAIILIAFSLALYYSFVQNIQDNFEGNYPNDQAQLQAVAKTTDQLQTDILLIDIAVLLVSSGLSYFLAGKTLKPIQRAMEKQKRFTADASHELRTPLAVVQTNLEVALREKDGVSEKVRSLITGAVDETKSMAQLTDDLLLLSKVESGSKNREFKKMNLTEVVDRTVERMQSIAHERSIRLSTDGAAVFIKGDVVLIQRLVENIVGNSLAFTPAGGSIEVSTAEREGQAMVCVRDTGIGIAREDLPRVLERFYRADKARGHGGTGLGLSIAAEIVSEHQGTIKIESEEGKGAAVTITFPSAS